MSLVNNKKDSGNGFIAQAGILAAAGIISRVIGLLYRSPLFMVIGDLGMGYYSSAYNYYTIILLISSYSIPSAISKVIAQKLAVGEYRNAHRLFKGALYYALTIGAIASIFLYFGAGLFVETSAIPVLRTFAPTIFIYGILGVLRGYFQAHKSMLQTSISQIIEQIANAVVSVGAAYLLIHLTAGAKAAAAADTQTEILRAVRGAMGSALGTGTGVVVALIFMLCMYMKHRREILGRVNSDHSAKIDSYGAIIRSITAIVTPFILSTAIFNLSVAVNTKVYTDIYPRLCDMDNVFISRTFGIFSGTALTIANIPNAFAAAMASAMIPNIAELAASGKIRECRSKVALAVKTTMMISIPCAVGLFVYAEPITLLLFPSTADSIVLASNLLRALSVSIVLFAYSTLNSSILQGLGYLNVPIWSSGIALILQTAAAMLLLCFTGIDIYTLAIVNTIYSGIMSVINQASLHKRIGYRQEFLRTFFLPLTSAAIMSLVSYGAYLILRKVTCSPRLSVIPAIIIAVPVYFISLILTKGITEEELLAIPKGGLLVRIFKKMRLMK